MPIELSDEFPDSKMRPRFLLPVSEKYRFQAMTKKILVCVTSLSDSIQRRRIQFHLSSALISHHPSTPKQMLDTDLLSIPKYIWVSSANRWCMTLELPDCGYWTGVECKRRRSRTGPWGMPKGKPHKTVP